MIRKRKLAIVAVGALLLTGLAFGVSANNRDGLKSSIVESRKGGFVCTPQAVAPGSRETKQYTANLTELQSLQTRRGVLQSDTNVVNNTCKDLKNKAKSKCQKDVGELRSIDAGLDKLNREIGQYEACKSNDITFSNQKTRLSFSPFRNTEKKTLVTGDNVLGEWTVSTKKGTAILNKLNFQAGAITDGYGYKECGVFSSYELQDGNGKVLSIGKISDPEPSLVARFIFSSPLVINPRTQKIQLVGKGFSESGVVPATCQFEMNLSDNARKQVEREGDTSGFGPYGYVYDVSAPIKGPAVQLSNAGGEIHILRNTGIYSFSVINDSNVDTYITDFIFTLQTQGVHFEKFESIIAEGLNFTEEINTFVCSPAAVSDTTTEIRCTAKDPKGWNIGKKGGIKNFFGINPYVKSVEIEGSQSTLLLKDIYFTQKNMVGVLKGFIPVGNWSVPFTATKRLPNGGWMTDEWSSCVNNEKARMVWCQSDGVEVEDMYCTYTKPMSSQSCSVTD